MLNTADDIAESYIQEILYKPEVVDRNTFAKHFIQTRSKYKVWSTYKDTKYGSRSIELWYVYYLRERFHVFQEGHAIEQTPNATFADLPIVYKSKSKQKVLLSKGYIDSKMEREPRTFPLKANTSKYSLHHVAPPNTWLVDVAFFHKFSYYVFINMNTRYLCVIPANSRITREGIVEIFANAKEATGIDF
jgi:hypothetical protein